MNNGMAGGYPYNMNNNLYQNVNPYNQGYNNQDPYRYQNGYNPYQGQGIYNYPNQYENNPYQGGYNYPYQGNYNYPYQGEYNYPYQGNLNYMHREGVCHRDIKADNCLFLTKNTESPLKVIDYGLAVEYLDPSNFFLFIELGSIRLSQILGTVLPL